MPNSLYSQEVQAVLDAAEKSVGQANAPYPSPMDWRDQPIYFIIVDRFNNPLAPPVHQPYDDQTWAGYQGGKFEGIRRQLPYIKQMGMGAIWLSPVLKNLPWDEGSYHGYAIHDFLRAEPKFALDPAKADDELRALVDAAHREGLYVIMDIVLNHTGDVFTYNGEGKATYSPSPLPVQWRDAAGLPVTADVAIESIANPSVDALVWPTELQKNEYYRRQGMTADGESVIGDFLTLKQLLTADPEVQGYLIRAYQYVMARFDIDGFRVDTIRYLQGNLAQLFGNAVREYALILGKQNFFTFGEVLDKDPEATIVNFIGRTTLIPEDMNSPVGVDAALDYPLFSVLGQVVRGFEPPTSIVEMYHRRKVIDQNLLSSHGDASRYFVTFLDNHDMKRRIRWVQPGDPNRFDDQVTMALACLAYLPGVPCIYYGTEQGLHGYSITGNDDPAVREAMWGIYPAFPVDGIFYTAIQQIMAIRNGQAALRYGRFYFRPVSGDGYHFSVSTYPQGILSWSRIINDEEVLVVANTNITSTLDVDVILELLLSSPGQQPRILYSNKPLPTAPEVVTAIITALVMEVDGTTGYGPLHTTHITLLPMEVQVIKIQAG
jgi:glycosidase